MSQTAEKIGRPKPPTLVIFYAAIFVVACVPLFAFAVLPLGDMPNHLARAYILNQLTAEPLLQKYYAIHWQLFSFQSTDFILPLLTGVFGLDLGHHLYVAADFALLIGGTAAVHKALFGRVGFWPAAAVLFLYSFPLALGQISFLFATGLSLLLFAAWVATGERRRIWRLAAFAAASFALMLCHFFAFAAYVLLVMAFELGRARRVPTFRRKVWHVAEAALPFVLPAIAFLLSFRGTINGGTFYGSIPAKVLSVLAGTVTYGRWPDIVITVTICAGLWLLDRRKLLRLAPDMRLPSIVLILAAIAMPRLLQGVLGADLRLPCLLAFLLVGASEVQFRGRRPAVAFILGVFVLLSLRVGTIVAQWSHFDADYREFRAADAVLPLGSRVGIIPMQTDLRTDPQPLLPYWFVACFAVIDRQVFMPLLYTFATPLEFTPAGADIFSDQLAKTRKVTWHPIDPAFVGAKPETVQEVEQAGQLMSDEDLYTSTIDWSDWPERFDYLIDFHFGRPGNPVPALLSEVARGSYFTIYRIHPPGR